MQIVVTCLDQDGHFKTFGCEVPADCSAIIIDTTDEEGMRDGKLVWGFKDGRGRLHQVYGEKRE